MAEQKVKLINYRAVDDMIKKRIDVLDNKAMECEGSVSMNISQVIKLFIDLRNELNEEWHEEIERWYEE